jgi:hypothetical protein
MVSILKTSRRICLELTLNEAGTQRRCPRNPEARIRKPGMITVAMSACEAKIISRISYRASRKLCRGLPNPSR